MIVIILLAMLILKRILMNFKIPGLHPMHPCAKTATSSLIGSCTLVRKDYLWSFWKDDFDFEFVTIIHSRDIFIDYIILNFDFKASGF